MIASSWRASPTGHNFPAGVIPNDQGNCLLKRPPTITERCNVGVPSPSCMFKLLLEKPDPVDAALAGTGKPCLECCAVQVIPKLESGRNVAFVD
jgi:hypothetical protein